LAEPRRLMAKGHIASPHIFPSIFLQTKGMVVMP
jgi:hypothetical protein